MEGDRLPPLSTHTMSFMVDGGLQWFPGSQSTIIRAVNYNLSSYIPAEKPPPPQTPTTRMSGQAKLLLERVPICLSVTAALEKKRESLCYIKINQNEIGILGFVPIVPIAHANQTADDKSKKEKTVVTLSTGYLLPLGSQGYGKWFY